MKKYKKTFFVVGVLALVLFIFLFLKESKKQKSLSFEDKLSDEFINERIVEIVGYNGDAMEPYISRDEKYLFFNNQKGSKSKDIYWAEKIDDLKYQFRGELGGVNTKFVDGNPTMDDNYNFYFITTRDLDSGSFGSVYTGKFNNGNVENLIKVKGSLNREKRMWLNMGVEVTAEGDEMYTSYAHFRFASKHPFEGNIRYAKKVGDEFNFVDNENDIFKNINTKEGIEYAGEVSRNGLELFYSQVTLTKPPRFKMYHSKRDSKEDIFGVPSLIAEPFKDDKFAFVEAPCLSDDGERLYYHKLRQGKFSIFMLNRNK